jgi:uncharacterized membrane protein YccC
MKPDAASPGGSQGLTGPPPAHPIHLSSPLHWSAEGPRTALLCLPAVALTLGFGLGFGQPAAGMVAASGALSVGFGAYQQLSSMRALPMILAALGMALSALAGSVLGDHPLAFAAMLALWAGFCGLVTSLGAGAWWTVLQWVIALLVASSRPGSVMAGLDRAGLVLAGGALQILIVSAGWRLRLAPRIVSHPLPRAPLRTAARVLRRHLTLKAATGRYALVVAGSAAAIDLVARQLSLLNGYWAPMTLLILMKPAFKDTLNRGIQRMLGTLGGAGVATLMAAWLRPSAPVSAGLCVALAFGCYALLRVNYMAYSLCITAYIAFMLTLAGTPEPVAAAARVIGTLAGGLAALLAHSAWTASERLRIRREGAPAETVA